MGRCVKSLVLHKPNGFVQFIMEDYLRKYNFRNVMWKKSEPVYRAGFGAIEHHWYLKWSYQDGVLKLEAWYRGAFDTEKEVNEYFTAYARKPYEKSLAELFEALEQEIPASGGTIQVKGVAMPDHSASVLSSAVSMGIAIASGFLSPFVGILIGFIGYYEAKKGMQSSLANIAKVTQIGNVVVIILFTIRYIFGFVAALRLFAG